MYTGWNISSPFFLSFLVNSTATFKITQELSPYFNLRTERLRFVWEELKVIFGAAESLNQARALVQEELCKEELLLR